MNKKASMRLQAIIVFDAAKAKEKHVCRRGEVRNTMGRKGSNDAPEAREIKQNGNAKHKKTGVRAENVSGRKERFDTQ